MIIYTPFPSETEYSNQLEYSVLVSGKEPVFECCPFASLPTAQRVEPLGKLKYAIMLLKVWSIF